MSAERHMSPSFTVPPEAVEGFGGMESDCSPMSEMETLRVFVNERLTAAVEDILGVFGETVARYWEQIDRQQRQLDSLKSEEGKWRQTADRLQASSWIKPCPDDQVLSVQLQQTDRVDDTDSTASAAHIKTEVGGECGVSEPNGDFDPAGGSKAVSDGGFLAESSETEDSGDHWSKAVGLWRSEEMAAAEGQSSSDRRKVRSSSDASPQPAPAFGCKVCGNLPLPLVFSASLIVFPALIVSTCSLSPCVFMVCVSLCLCQFVFRCHKEPAPRLRLDSTVIVSHPYLVRFFVSFFVTLSSQCFSSLLFPSQECFFVYLQKLCFVLRVNDFSLNIDNKRLV
ncbi:uncharacterized protein LOC117263494 isoform X2 [Epinephelus lanceolatus]